MSDNKFDLTSNEQSNSKQNNTKDIIVKFVELIDKKNLDYKNIQTNYQKENKHESSK